MAEQSWLGPAQQHAVVTAMAVLRAWAEESDDPEDVLLETLRRQDPATVIIGLATVARLLAVELGVCSHRTEAAVLADLAERVASAAPAGNGPARRW
jgi:hypothetical protein